MIPGIPRDTITDISRESLNGSIVMWYINLSVIPIFSVSARRKTKFWDGGSEAYIMSRFPVSEEPGPAPAPSRKEQMLTDEQIQMCIDFLTDLEFTPVQ